VVGNPRPGSRTLAAATTLARRLVDAEPGPVVDLATLGPALLDPQDASLAALVDEIGAADLVVVASPTYKATYTGLLKLFLDRFAGGVGIRGVAVPLMLGAAPHHALAPELHLRPLLVELGASVPTPALYVLDREHDRPEPYDAWLARSRPLVHAHLGPLPARTTGAQA
jgi:FMN reductase